MNSMLKLLSKFKSDKASAAKPQPEYPQHYASNSNSKRKYTHPNPEQRDDDNVCPRCHSNLSAAVAVADAVEQPENKRSLIANCTNVVFLCNEG